jgi:hypothetical protein
MRGRLEGWNVFQFGHTSPNGNTGLLDKQRFPGSPMQGTFRQDNYESLFSLAHSYFPDSGNVPEPFLA